MSELEEYAVQVAAAEEATLALENGADDDAIQRAAADGAERAVGSIGECLARAESAASRARAASRRLLKASYIDERDAWIRGAARVGAADMTIALATRLSLGTVRRIIRSGRHAA